MGEWKNYDDINSQYKIIEKFGKSMNQKDIEKAWEEFSDGCVDENDCIDTVFYKYPVGTFREDIWHDFENLFNVNIPESIMTGKLHFHNETRITIDLEELYKKYAPDNSKCGEINLSHGKIRASVINAFSGKPEFYDFIGPHNSGICCMTGEQCEIISLDSESITLRNHEGEKSTDFILSLDEFEIASGESNSLNLIVKEAVKQKDSANKDSKENEISGIDRGER